MDELIESLKVVLGTGFALYVKISAFHWNCEGIEFPSIHPFLGEMYTKTWESLDDIAEQIRQLDAYAPGTMERFLKLSRITSENSVPAPREMMIILFRDQETMMEVLTEAFGLATKANKQGLANFLAERLEFHSKMRWQLRATAKRLGATIQS